MAVAAICTAAAVCWAGKMLERYVDDTYDREIGELMRRIIRQHNEQNQGG